MLIHNAMDGKRCRQGLFDFPQIGGKGVIFELSRLTSGSNAAFISVEVEGVVGIDRRTLPTARENELSPAAVAGKIVVRDRSHGDYRTGLK